MDAAAPKKIGLTLSGGGFRATLYHLGVIRYLREIGELPNVSQICSVSGGSIAAAHLVLNWDRYIGTPAQFDEAAKELLDFIRIDMRGRVVRRWIFGFVSLLRFLRPGKWGRTDLLTYYYSKLYKNKMLGSLNEAKAGRVPPALHILATSMTTGNLCSFSARGFSEDLGDKATRIDISDLPVAYAVAASSAFPPFFPPVELTADMLSVTDKEFPHKHFLADGGVFDNLGIRKLYLLETREHSFLDFFMVSDAQPVFNWV